MFPTFILGFLSQMQLFPLNTENYQNNLYLSCSHIMEILHLISTYLVIINKFVLLLTNLNYKGGKKHTAIR